MHELKTDLYQLTMMAAAFLRGKAKQVITCEAFARRLPASRKFMVMAGTEQIHNYLLNLRFSEEDILYLKEVPALKSVMATSNFESYLKEFKFTGDFWSMAEGEIAFAGEPLVRITAPLPEAQIVETYILSVLNNSIKVSSKAARIVLAARGKPVLEFATRRAHPEEAIAAARSAYLAGFTGTSNVAASKLYNIPVKGTMSHLWVMVHEDELESFKSFKKTYISPTLLIDTYDPIEGTKKAASISSVRAVRLDSGNLDTLSREMRKILDDKSKNTKIIVSGDLDEYKIYELTKSSAPIDCFAVGTQLVAPKDSQSLGIVYKAVYDNTNDKPILKKSSEKLTFPGVKQVFHDQRGEKWSHIVSLDGAITAEPDLVPILDNYIKDGSILQEPINLDAARQYCNASLVSLPSELSSIEEGKGLVPVHPHKSMIDMFERAIK